MPYGDLGLNQLKEWTRTNKCSHLTGQTKRIIP